MSRLLIVQPYIPAYRVPFFAALRAQLAAEGIELWIAAGRPHGSSAQRRDDASDTADKVLRESRLTFAGRTFNVRHLSENLRTLRPEFVIVEQAVKNIEVYPLLARHAVGQRPRVAMWGQGRTFSTIQGPTMRALKAWLTRRSDWFFAYTQEGADYVVARGFARDRITVLHNSTDTETLRAELRAVTIEQLMVFRGRYGLTSGATALFLGGLDASKGIEFLVESARLVAKQIPGFRLLVGGEGACSDWLRERQAAGDPVIALGRIDGPERALAMRSANLMMVPQWVGLVAVDSLAAGTPIVTTRHASHSPEFGYLTDGVNAVVTEHDLGPYAAAVVALLGDPDRLAILSEGALADSRPYSIEAMATRFSEGVRQWAINGS
jgi:glycosyltransferase involved in cell wall biosynthesis